jgi:hypothetical protein
MKGSGDKGYAEQQQQLLLLLLLLQEAVEGVA